ncbi:MAG: homoserine O-succinyltransferase [Gemmatimonadales bacterium]
MTLSLQLDAPPASEIFGHPDGPVIVAIGGISATHHVAAHPGNPEPGWWDEFVGPARAIDPARCRILGFDFITAAIGSTTTHDQADALAQLLDQLGIATVHAIVGASYGGMVALAFAERYPGRVDQLVLISAPHKSHPMTTAIRVVQRRILRFGISTGRPAEAVALARGLGITTYRTAAEFAERFGGDATVGESGARFPVEDYLDVCGERFAARFPIARYLALSESLDLHRVDPTQLRLPVTIVAVEGDTLVPVWQLHQLRALLAGAVRFEVIRSRYGHDAFLKEIETIGAIVSDALALGGIHAA